MREYRGNGLLHDADLAVRELEDYAAHGGGTLAELTPVEGGRDPKRLAEVSLASGVRGSLAPVLAVSCCGVTNLRHTQADRGM